QQADDLRFACRQPLAALGLILEALRHEPAIDENDDAGGCLERRIDMEARAVAAGGVIVALPAVTVTPGAAHPGILEVLACTPAAQGCIQGDRLGLGTRRDVGQQALFPGPPLELPRAETEE